jgi:hypothetical protein
MRISIIIFALALFVFPVNGDANISLMTNTNIVNYGENIILTVRIDPNDQKIGGMQFHIQADNDKMIVIDVTEGDLFTTNNVSSYFWGGSGVLNNVTYNQMPYGYSDWIFGVCLGPNYALIPGNFATITLRGVGAGISNIAIGGVLVATNDALPAAYNILNNNLSITIIQTATPYISTGGGGSISPVVTVTPTTTLANTTIKFEDVSETKNYENMTLLNSIFNIILTIMSFINLVFDKYIFLIFF